KRPRLEAAARLETAEEPIECHGKCPGRRRADGCARPPRRPDTSEDQRVSLPALMQEVQTLSRFGVPFTFARTRCTLGSKRRRVRRCECDTLLPYPGPLPQTSQTAATDDTPQGRND